MKLVTSAKTSLLFYLTKTKLIFIKHSLSFVSKQILRQEKCMYLEIVCIIYQIGGAINRYELIRQIDVKLRNAYIYLHAKYAYA